MGYRSSTILCKLAYAIAFSVVTSAVWGQAFPNKPIKLLSGFPPSFLDNVVRVLNPVMIQELGQPILLDFRVGAGGTLAVDAVAKGAPDGYTLVIAEHSAVTYMQHLRKDLPYDPYKDLAIVSPIYRGGFFIAAGPTLKARDLRELIAEAKANPGKITYGHAGLGTMHHLTMELFQTRAGIKLFGVAFKGGNPAMTAAVGGQVDLIISGETNTVAQINAGRLKPITTTADARWKSSPNTPTLGEFLPGFKVFSMASYLARAGTPGPILEKLNAATVKALRDPETSAKLVALGIEPLPATLEDGNRLWREEGEKWAEVIKNANITME